MFDNGFFGLICRKCIARGLAPSTQSPSRHGHTKDAAMILPFLLIFLVLFGAFALLILTLIVLTFIGAGYEEFEKFERWIVKLPLLKSLLAHLKRKRAAKPAPGV